MGWRRFLGGKVGDDLHPALSKELDAPPGFEPLTQKLQAMRSHFTSEDCMVYYTGGLNAGLTVNNNITTDKILSQLAFAANGSRVHIGLGNIKLQGKLRETILVSNEHNAFQTSFRAHLLRNSRGRTFLLNEVIELQESAQRKGYSRFALALQIRAAILLGINNIYADVRGGNGSRFIGHIVWPTLGFDGRIPDPVWEKLPKEARPDSNSENVDLRKLSNFLASSSTACQAWKRNGSGFLMRIDVDPATTVVANHLNFLRRVML